MSDFTEKIKMRGKVEEDIYFAKLNQKLIEALHEKMAQKANKESDQDDQRLAKKTVTDSKNPPK